MSHFTVHPNRVVVDNHTYWGWAPTSPISISGTISGALKAVDGGETTRFIGCDFEVPRFHTFWISRAILPFEWKWRVHMSGEDWDDTRVVAKFWTRKAAIARLVALDLQGAKVDYS